MNYFISENPNIIVLPTKIKVCGYIDERINNAGKNAHNFVVLYGNVLRVEVKDVTTHISSIVGQKGINYP